MNSLKTLSSQIYSASTRILYEIVQNADDCSFPEVEEGESGATAPGSSSASSSSSQLPPRELRELYLECSDDALVAFHNEKGFQPKDLYAMSQVSP